MDAIPASAQAGLASALAAGWVAMARFDITPDADRDTGGFFAALPKLAATLRQRGLTETSNTIDRHAIYLARKRGLADAAGLNTMPQPDDVLTREAIRNVAGALDGVALDRLALDVGALDEGALDGGALDEGGAGLPPDVLRAICAAEATLEGWCTRAKAVAIAQLVLAERPRVAVEIGVYGGRSLVPCAAALAAFGAGKVYGVESWTASEATRNATDAVNDLWWTRVDFDSIKRRFWQFVVDHALTRHVCLIEAASRSVAGAFDTIDYLHIDGSHAVIGAAEDVLLYATKVRSGGVIIFDDTNWETTQAAQQMLGALCVPMMSAAEVKAANYAVFRRR